MMSDVDQEIRLDETLDSSLACDSRYNLEGGWGDVDIGDKDTGREVVGGAMLSKCAHLFDSYIGVWEKLNPNGTDI